MALELVGGAALGVVFSELYGVVKDVLAKGCMLKSRLEDLTSELNCWEPMVERIMQLSNTVGHPREETEALIEKMEAGKNLVQKCSNRLRSYGCGLNLLKTSNLEDELRWLQEAIRKFFQTYIPLYMARIGLEDLAVSNVIKAKVDLVANNGSQGLQFLEALQTSVNGMQTSVNSLQTSVNDMQTSVQSLQTGVYGLQTGVQGVETTVNGVQTSVNSVQTTVNGVQTSINGMQIDMQALVNSLQTTVIGVQNDMWTRITNMQTSMNALQTSVHALHQAQNLGARNVRLSCAVPLLPEFIIGSGKPLEEVKRRLLYEKVSPLVLTGPGGCGKTTLAIRFGHDQQIKDVFKENIFFITVSPAPEVRSIARDLFDHLGRSVPEFHSDEHAIHQVGLLLGEIGSPILLIMDNIWPTSEHLIMEFKFNIPNYHILVTSGTAIGEDKAVYTLQPLDDEHAMKLLRHSAVLRDDGHLIPEECIKKVLRDCGGYPLALEEIGRSFRGKPSEAWKSWVMDRSDGHLTLDSCGKMLKCHQESLRFLDDEVKECFLDLGLFPLGQSIPLIALIEIWTVLYKLDRAGVRAISILTQISSHNLAHFTRIHECYHGGDYSGYFVEQHNLLRELAIHQSNQEPIGHRKRLILPISENKSLDSHSGKEPLYIKARSLSITIDEKFSSNEHIIQPSEVEVLVLNFQLAVYLLLKFAKKMEKLKVIIVTNYGFPCAVKQENWSAPRLRKRILGSTSLVICCIGQASGNCGIEISNVFPNAVEIHMDSCSYLVELPVEAFGNLVELSRAAPFSSVPYEAGRVYNISPSFRGGRFVVAGQSSGGSNCLDYLVSGGSNCVYNTFPSFGGGSFGVAGQINGGSNWPDGLTSGVIFFRLFSSFFLLFSSCPFFFTSFLSFLIFFLLFLSFLLRPPSRTAATMSAKFRGLKRWVAGQISGGLNCLHNIS